MDFVRDNPGEPVQEEAFTHSHLSWSSIVRIIKHEKKINKQTENPGSPENGC